MIKVLIPVLFLILAACFGVLLGMMEKEVYKAEQKEWEEEEERRRHEQSK